MARIRNEQVYDETRSKLLTVGMNLIRAGSYESIGINDILREGQIPKGSFYHYFKSKEAFGREVLQFYHEQQVESASALLTDPALPPLERLQMFFKGAYDDFEAKGFAQGCLMCNLSTELADEHPAFQSLLQEQWHALSAQIALCVAELDKAEIGLAHLSDKEAADWLLNSWSGALTRMKAMRDGAPLRLFLKTTFKEGL